MGSRYYSNRLKNKKAREKRRPARPKSFKSEESAKKWAEAKGIKEYKLVSLKVDPTSKHKKIRVVESK